MQSNKSNLLLNFLVLVLLVLPQFPLVFAQDNDSGGFKYLEVKVLDPAGKPMEEVEVEVSIDGAAFPMLTDDEGYIGFNVPDEGIGLLLKVQQEGFTAIGARWNKEDKLPKEFTITMQKGVTIGGIVHDEDGQPVEGATVEGTIRYGGFVGGQSGKGGLRPMLDGEIATTDSAGRWKTSLAPNKETRLNLEFSHPDFIATRNVQFDANDFKEFLNLGKTTVLHKGIDLRGRVLDPNGEPVVGAKLLLAFHWASSNRLEAETNDNGEYLIEKAPPGKETLTVTSSDWAPELLRVDLSAGMEPLDIRLKPSQTIRLRVVDTKGEPVEGVRVTPEEWRGSQTLGVIKGNEATDADGVWKWNAPEDTIRYELWKKGYFSSRDQDSNDFIPSEEIHEITILPEVVISGRIVDKETGQPIKKFTLTEGVWWRPNYGQYTLQDSRKETGRDGTYRHMMDNGCTKFLLRIEAEGYLPSLSRPIFPEEGNAEIDFELEAGTGPRGIVKLPDGSLAGSVEVFMATSDRIVLFSNGRINRQAVKNISTTTDSAGHFSFSIAEREYTLVCAGDQGWAEIEGKNITEASIEMVLQPWSNVSCQVKLGEKLLAGEKVYLGFHDLFYSKPSKVYWHYQAETDEEGNFTLNRVRSGTAFATRTIGYADRGSGNRRSVYSYVTAVQIETGKTLQFAIGGTGRIVTGLLAVPEDLSGEEISWTMGIVQLSKSTTEGSGNSIENSGPRSNQLPGQRYAAPISAEGKFEIIDVLPGAYEMEVKLFSSTQPLYGSRIPLYSLKKIVRVPTGNKTTTVNLGNHLLELNEESTP